MSIYVAHLPHLDSRTVNRAVRNAITEGLFKYRSYLPGDITYDVKRRRGAGRNDYVHGYDTQLRSTWVATWEARDSILRIATSPVLFRDADWHTRVGIVARDYLQQTFVFERIQ